MTGHSFTDYVVGGFFLVIFVGFMFVRQIVRDAIKPFWLPNADIPTPLGAGLGIIFAPVILLVIVIGSATGFFS